LAYLADDTKRWGLVELNVHRQVRDVAVAAIVHKTRREERRPLNHGWVCDLKTGYSKKLENPRARVI
jgi:carbonic anhydrase